MRDITDKQAGDNKAANQQSKHSHSHSCSAHWADQWGCASQLEVLSEGQGVVRAHAEGYWGVWEDLQTGAWDQGQEDCAQDTHIQVQRRTQIVLVNSNWIQEPHSEQDQGTTQVS